jgi:hypothetical protein
VSVTAITFDPLSGVVKGTQTVKITATFENTGTLDAIDMAPVFSVGGVEITACVAKINVSIGGTNTTFCDYVIPTSTDTKTYAIDVKADGNMTVDLVALPTPHTHLGIVGIAFNPSALVALEDVDDTQMITVTVTVKNDGDKDAVNAIVELKADAVVAGTNNSVNVTKGDQAIVTFEYDIATKEDLSIVNFTASITLGTDIASDWKNISVPGDLDHPDYALDALTVSPAASCERGLKATISVTVKNIGDADATSVTLKFWAGTTALGTKVVENVTAGGAGNVTTFEWTILATFAVAATEINVTVEGTTPTVFKNISYAVIEYKKPVLTIEFQKDKKGKVMSYSSSAAEGAKKTLKIKVLIANTGTADAKNVRIGIFNSKNVEIGNATVTGTIVAGAAATEYIVLVKMKAGTSTKITAKVTYEGIHADTYSAETAGTTSAKVVKTPGFEAVVMVAAVAVALVVLSRRKK